ncbi:hypothetical protein OC846_006865, partial [Tilletia horrida]
NPYEHFEQQQQQQQRAQAVGTTIVPALGGKMGAKKGQHNAGAGSSGAGASSGSGLLESQLSRLVQEVLGSASESVRYVGEARSTDVTYGQEEMEHLLLKALQAGVNAGGSLQHHQQ